MQDNPSIDWITTLKNIAVSSTALFFQGALFALGGIAVAKVISKSDVPLLAEGGNIVPLKRTGT